MLKKINKIASIVCCLSIAVYPFHTYADNGKITTVREGEPALYSGTLLDDKASSKLLAEVKFCEKECDLKIKKEIDLLLINHESLIKSERLKLQVETKRLSDMIAVRDDRIDFLEKNHTPPAWYESSELWFAVGVISGIGITVAAGYAIGQVK